MLGVHMVHGSVKTNQIIKDASMKKTCQLKQANGSMLIGANLTWVWQYGSESQYLSVDILEHF